MTVILASASGLNSYEGTESDPVLVRLGPIARIRGQQLRRVLTNQECPELPGPGSRTVSRD